MMKQRVQALAHRRIFEQEHAGHDFLKIRVLLVKKALHRLVGIEKRIQFFK